MVESLTLKTKQRVLQITPGTPRKKMVFCPIDGSKNFHRAFFHDRDGLVWSACFDFRASQPRFEVFLQHRPTLGQLKKPGVVCMGMAPTAVYDEPWLDKRSSGLHGLDKPRFECAVVDPGAVAENRTQHSFSSEKKAYLDGAAMGALLTRGRYTPARRPEPRPREIQELSRLLNRRQAQLNARCNQLLVRVERICPNLLREDKDEKP